MSLSIQTNIASLDAQNFVPHQHEFSEQHDRSSSLPATGSTHRVTMPPVSPWPTSMPASIAVLNQGVLNASNGVSSLQIIDGGLSNISTIINRLQTLATESASNTFTGDRTTLNTEYQGLLQEIDRQAANVNLNTGGSVQHQ